MNRTDLLAGLRILLIRERQHHLGEVADGLLVMIADGDLGGQDAPIGVRRGQTRGELGGEVVEL